MAGPGAGWYAYGPNGSAAELNKINYVDLTAAQAENYAVSGTAPPGMPANYFLINGPYGSMSAAKSAMQGLHNASGGGTGTTTTSSNGGGGGGGDTPGGIIGGIIGGLGGGGVGGAAGGAVSGALGPLSGITEAGHWLGVIASHLTDRHMWISLGWLFLGWGLLGFGFFFIMKRTGAYKKIRSAELSVAKTAASAA